MSVSPDFSAMLDAIVHRADEAASSPISALLLATSGQADGSPIFPLRIAAFDPLLPDEEALPDEETGTGIVDAVTAGCAGMADRRLMRGDTYGAAHWQEAADTEQRRPLLLLYLGTIRAAAGIERVTRQLVVLLAVLLDAYTRGEELYGYAIMGLIH